MKSRPAGKSSVPPPPRPRRRTLWLWLAAGLPVGWLAQQLASAHPERTDRWYSRTMFPPLRRGCEALASLFPVSLAEVVLLSGVLLATGWGLRGIRRALARRSTWPRVLCAGLRRMAATVGVVYALFLLLWGFNYARLPLAQGLELPLREAERTELFALCLELRDRCELERVGLTEDSQGVFQLEAHGEQLRANVGAAMRAAAARNAAWAPLDGADPLLRFPWLSPLLTRFGITGVWSPFTAEAHVNDHVPDLLQPFTACHEAAHGRGFAKEDEASFVAFAVGRNAPSRELRYSAGVCALRTALGRLEPSKREAILMPMGGGMRRDMRALDAFWKSQRNWAMGVADKANHAYLQVQGDPRGTLSYGGLIDLMLAERRIRGSTL